MTDEELDRAVREDTLRMFGPVAAAALDSDEGQAYLAARRAARAAGFAYWAVVRERMYGE